jgi:HlyD family secretion protein
MSTTTKKKSNWRLIAIVGGILALTGAAIYRAQSKPKGIEVYAEAAQKRTISETVSASGKIFPETEVKISSDVSGEVTELYVKEGDSVTVGQILAKIRPDEYQSALEQGEASVNTARAQRDISSGNINGATAQLEQLRADLNRAKAQLEVAQKSFQRSDKLYKEGVVSSAEFDNAQNTLRSAEAGVKVAEAALKSGETNLANAKENVRVADYGINSANARLKELRTSLQKTIITAPVSGVISKLNIEKGERVVGTLQMAGTEMMRIANFQSMEVQVDVSENDINKVALGNITDIEVDAYLGRKFKGKVTEIANSASNVGSGSAAALNTDQVTNFIVKIRVDPTSYTDLIKPGKTYPFRPGMSASVDIFTNTVNDALSVPLIAVTTREKKDAPKPDDDDAPEAKKVALDLDDIKEIVFVVVGDTVGIKEVKTGIQDNDHIVILSGLNEGDQVVTGPYTAVSRKLESGKKINIVDKNKKVKSEE